MEQKLFDSERKVMEALWDNGELTAKELSVLLAEEVGWNKNTTYTVIKKCIDKGVIARTEPGFHCRALLTREQARQAEADDLMDKLFDGSPATLFASLLDGGRVPPEELDKLRRMIEELK
ncbi:BlaI/MecI/CopY family transcriptional regulator [Intestinibacillus massiliensis]|uniref:BlaI/MecI/CopY family transcriptional regulator n=1 Tax=Intestinibacillus massiliensis TaxID=1871029 RepID=UPI000B35ED0B|nr:BlaI/MecI/CopY family transcriptional regulator [Intestinibacillus massiliensis]MCB6365222.1 BlaI/MecI/CopY family transcriptional regulator [Intestinibacillus massiliensis]